MKIICIGRNYAEHVVELDHTRELPDAPQFFLKPDTALLRNNDPFYSARFQPGSTLRNGTGRQDQPRGPCDRRTFCPGAITPKWDWASISPHATLQRTCIAKGLPWEIAKAFDHSAALSPSFIPLAELGGNVQNLHFEMKLNGETRQLGFTGDMLFPVDRIIAHVSRFITLKMGDLIYTGTPVGVGPSSPATGLTASLEGYTLLDFDIH